MICKVCKGKDVVPVYHGYIRDGVYGTQTKQKYKVLECDNCGATFLDPVPVINYDLPEYREKYNESNEINDYYILHDKQQINYLNILKGTEYRNKIICDIGCGGGAFLDHVSGLAKETIAVEPNKAFHSELAEKGHVVFNSLDELFESEYSGVIDLMVSFHVIEHVESPYNFLLAVKNILKQNGKAFIITPNYDDILLQLNIDRFPVFYFRTAHPWYLNKKVFNYLCSELYINEYSITYQQNYDLSNFVLWLKEGKPTGNGKIEIFSNNLNVNWKLFLENSGMADTIILSFINNQQ